MFLASELPPDDSPVDDQNNVSGDVSPDDNQSMAYTIIDLLNDDVI